MTTRRGFLSGCVAALWAASTGCGVAATGAARAAGSPRLRARPGETSREAVPGVAALGLSSSSRDGLLFIPQHDPAIPMPLFVALHGAGGRAQDWAGMREMASDRGLVLLAPESRGTTWDRVHGAFGPDVAFLDRALTHVFERCSVDRRRVALGGFSDGASYALSLGLANGDLFTHVVAFSPGFVHVPPEAPGHPQVFVSHGLQDAVLPVWLSRGQVVPYLRERGYGVRYEEFDGGHEIPRGTLRSALEWLTV